MLTLGNTPGRDALAALVVNKGVEELGEGRYRIFFDEDNSITERYIEESVKNNWELRELSVERCGLDQIFAQLSGKAGNK